MASVCCAVVKKRQPGSDGNRHAVICAVQHISQATPCRLRQWSSSTRLLGFVAWHAHCQERHASCMSDAETHQWSHLRKPGGGVLASSIRDSEPAPYANKTIIAPLRAPQKTLRCALRMKRCLAGGDECCCACALTGVRCNSDAPSLSWPRSPRADSTAP